MSPLLKAQKLAVADESLALVRFAGNLVIAAGNRSTRPVLGLLGVFVLVAGVSEAHCLCADSVQQRALPHLVSDAILREEPGGRQAYMT
jgi:hypothetical protein